MARLLFWAAWQVDTPQSCTASVEERSQVWMWIKWISLNTLSTTCLENQHSHLQSARNMTVVSTINMKKRAMALKVVHIFSADFLLLLGGQDKDSESKTVEVKYLARNVSVPSCLQEMNDITFSAMNAAGSVLGIKQIFQFCHYIFVFLYFYTIFLNRIRLA